MYTTSPPLGSQSAWTTGLEGGFLLACGTLSGPVLCWLLRALIFG